MSTGALFIRILVWIAAMVSSVFIVAIAFTYLPPLVAGVLLLLVAAVDLLTLIELLKLV